LTDRTQTVVITLKPFSGKGRSKLLVKLKSDRVYPDSKVPESFDSKIEMDNDDDDVISVNLHQLKRIYEDPDCDLAGY